MFTPPPWNSSCIASKHKTHHSLSSLSPSPTFVLLELGRVSRLLHNSPPVAHFCPGSVPSSLRKVAAGTNFLGGETETDTRQSLKERSWSWSGKVVKVTQCQVQKPRLVLEIFILKLVWCNEYSINFSSSSSRKLVVGSRTAYTLDVSPWKLVDIPKTPESPRNCLGNGKVSRRGWRQLYWRGCGWRRRVGIRVFEYSTLARPPALPLCRMFREMHFSSSLLFWLWNCFELSYPVQSVLVRTLMFLSQSKTFV